MSRVEEADLDPEPSPDLIFAYLPPGPLLEDRLKAIRDRWPEASLIGCEAVTQFRQGSLEREGCLQLFWWHTDEPEISIHAVSATSPEELRGEALDEVSRVHREADTILILADGLRFPVQPLLAKIRERVDAPVGTIAGGLASQAEPIEGPGARVFVDDEILSSAAVVVGVRGLDVDVRVVRGWDPASPVYEVTRAEDNVVFEIDGEAAVHWYERFFRLPEGMAPMPDSAYRFPLILDGPDPARQGLYRSMRFFDDPPGAVTFWGDFREGDRVRLGIGNEASLTRAAGDTVSGTPMEAAVLFSCVGREVVLGDRAEEEVAAVHGALQGIPLAGFFTFGEIGPSASGAPAYYNQTAILALLREKT